MAATTSQKARDLSYIGLCAALMTLCAWITIPMPSGVGHTLQMLGVFLTLGLLGGKRGTTAVLVYILLGAAGAPVFSGFRGGIGVLLGNTGGYILGFLLSALLLWAMERVLGLDLPVLAAGMVLGLLLCYGFGTVWFMAIYAGQPMTWGAVLAWCVVPYALPDLAKLALALLLTRRLRRHIL